MNLSPHLDAPPSGERWALAAMCIYLNFFRGLDFFPQIEMRAKLTANTGPIVERSAVKTDLHSVALRRHFANHGTAPIPHNPRPHGANEDFRPICIVNFKLFPRTLKGGVEGAQRGSACRYGDRRSCLAGAVHFARIGAGLPAGRAATDHSDEACAFSPAPSQMGASFGTVRPGPRSPPSPGRLPGPTGPGRASSGLPVAARPRGETRRSRPWLASRVPAMRRSSQSGARVTSKSSWV